MLAIDNLIGMDVSMLKQIELCSKVDIDLIIVERISPRTGWFVKNFLSYNTYILNLHIKDYGMKGYDVTL